jgi:hypothetical protein
VPAAGRIRAWLPGSGYAPAAAFNEPDHLMLPAAVRDEAAQAGRGDGDGRASVPPAGRRGPPGFRSDRYLVRAGSRRVPLAAGAEQRDRGSVMGRPITMRYP